MSIKIYPRSKALFERAQRSLAGGVSSEYRKASPHPLFYSHARGSRMFDVDENEYIDFTLSQGPMILGHSHPEVNAAAARASDDGQLFAAVNLREVELAELLQRLIPCAELVRFSVTGSEADHAALRIARGVTGRQKFIRFEGQYHGWYDNVAYGVGAPNLAAMGEREHPTAVPWTQGLPARAQDEFVLLPWNDLELVRKTLETQGDQIAAIITEPVMCNSGCIEPLPGYLQGLRDLCNQYGCALIFDEVITGFRLALGGAQSYYGVTPDIAVFAKAMANGFPISALVGTRKWMQPVADGKIIHAGTANGNSGSVAAALATIQILERENAHARITLLGQRLRDGLARALAASKHTGMVGGPGPMVFMAFAPEGTPAPRDLRGLMALDRAKFARFASFLQDRGVRVLARGLWYMSAAHSEADVDQTVGIVGAALAEFE